MNALESILTSGAPSLWWEFVASVTCQASLAAIVLLGITCMCRGMNPHWRHALLVLVVIKFLVPPWWSAPWGLFSQSEALVGIKPESWTLGATTDSPRVERPPETATSLDPTVVGNLPELTSPLVDAEPSAVDLQKQRTPSAEPGIRGWLRFLMLAHAGGTALVVLWLVRQCWSLERLVRSGRVVTQGRYARRYLAIAASLRVSRLPRLVIVPGAMAPISCGVFRPTVMVGRTTLRRMSREAVDVVLAHELSHHLRGDLWVTGLATLACALWWFNPLAWVVASRLRQVREDCCDDFVLSGGRISALEYCQALLRAAKATSYHPPMLAAPMVDARHPLARRFRRIMNPLVRHAPGVGWMGGVWLVVLAAGILPGTAARGLPSRPEASRAEGIIAEREAVDFPLPDDPMELAKELAELDLALAELSAELAGLEEMAATVPSIDSTHLETLDSLARTLRLLAARRDELTRLAAQVVDQAQGAESLLNEANGQGGFGIE